MTVSTHVLDAVAGAPARGVSVELSVRDDGGSWRSVETGVTDDDGRIRFAAEIASGVYRLTFATGRYFSDHGLVGFYPEVVISFSAVTEVGATSHFHVPLLLSPYAYSTYRGT